MVRFAGQTPTMDNREELLDALNDFSRKQPKEIPPLLEQFLKQVAKTGETLFPWTLLKPLFVAKLEQVMAEFGQEFAREQLPPCPNVENARFEVYKSRIMEAVHRFNGAPFTIQRLCELLTEPRRHYKRCDKFMRGLEKNVLVVSTVDPFGRKVVSESKNLMNGMDSSNSPEDSPPTTASNSTTPPVPSWTTSSPTTVWPANADAIITSTSPLLEVSDLPDPKEAAIDAAAATGAPTTTSTSQESPASSPAQVNGHHNVSSSIEVRTESDPATVTSAGSGARPEAAASSVVTPVTSVAEAVDSSDQLVAAEEMVGVEEDGEAAATSTEISQQAAVVEETVVEVPSGEEVSKAAAEATESSGEATSAGSGDWISNVTDSKETAASSTPAGPQESSDTSSADTVTPDTSSTVQASADSDTAHSRQDTSSTEAEAVSGDREEGGADTVKTSEGEGVSATEEDAGGAGKTVSSTHVEESVSDSSTSHPEAVDSGSGSASSESSSSSNTSTAISDSTSTQSPSSDADTTTTTTSASTPVDEVTSKDDQPEASTAAEAQPAESMETDSGESSSNTSQAAESSEPCPAASDSDTKDTPSDSSDSTATAEPMEHD